MELSTARNNQTFHIPILLACAGICNTVALQDLDIQPQMLNVQKKSDGIPTRTSAGDQISFLGLHRVSHFLPTLQSSVSITHYT